MSWRLFAFVLFAYAISWLLWTPLLVARPAAPLASWLYFGGVVGPAAAAVILSVRDGGAGALRSFAARWRVPLRWYLLALLLPFAIQAISGLASFAMGKPLVLRHATRLGPSVALLFLLVALEELGWRGYLLPRLQERYSALLASLIAGVIWGTWHLPLAWYAGGFQASDRPLVYMTRFVITILPISCLATWLFNHSGGSILIVTLYHLAVDMADKLFVLPQDVGNTVLWVSTAVSTLVVAAIWRLGGGRVVVTGA